MADRVMVKLTPKQAKILWGVVDGAADAGSCKDGLSKEELRALEIICTQITDQIHLTTLKLKEKKKRPCRKCGGYLGCTGGPSCPGVY